MPLSYRQLRISTRFSYKRAESVCIIETNIERKVILYFLHGCESVGLGDVIGQDTITSHNSEFRI